MPNLYIMRGVPGSGKSTIALNIAQHENAYIVSYDTMRSMLSGEEDYSRVYTHFTNSLVAELADVAAKKLFLENLNVIIDNTNLRFREINHWLSLCPAYYKITIVTVDAALQTCSKRSKKRKKIIPEGVIENMYRMYLEIDLTTYKNEKFPVINFNMFYT